MAKPQRIKALTLMTKLHFSFWFLILTENLAPHLVSDVVIFFLRVLRLSLEPLCPLGAASRCLW